MIKKINQFFAIPRLLVLYWAMFWLMNGLDKFLSRSKFNDFTWHGKDRSEQFGGYFTSCGLPADWVQPLLLFTGVWELMIFVPLFVTLLNFAVNSRLDKDLFELGMIASAATFIAFATCDIIFGDRAELLEHSTFIMLVAVTYRLVLGNQAFQGKTQTL